jgi:hypothetical protein
MCDQSNIVARIIKLSIFIAVNSYSTRGFFIIKKPLNCGLISVLINLEKNAEASLPVSLGAHGIET